MKLTVGLLFATLGAMVLAEDYLGQTGSFLNPPSPASQGSQHQTYEPSQYQDYGQMQSFRPQQQQVVEASNGASSAAAMGYGPGISNAGIATQADVVPAVSVGTATSVVTPALGASVPGFYFNGGFNKNLGFSLPKPFSKLATVSAAPAATYYTTYPYGYPAVAHSPLGELLATKADLIPAILKTGLVATVILVIFKLMVMLFAFKAAKLSAVANLANRVPKPVKPSGGSINVASVSGGAQAVPAEVHASSTTYSNNNFMASKEGPVKDAIRKKRAAEEKMGRPALSDNELDHITHRMAVALEKLPKNL